MHVYVLCVACKMLLKVIIYITTVISTLFIQYYIEGFYRIIVITVSEEIDQDETTMY